MNVESKHRVALSLLAHPDDAEMQCAGTLIRLADAGWEIHIATVANGDCGSATLPRAEIAAVRRKEGIAAAGRGKTGLLASHASEREWVRADHGTDECGEAMKRCGADRGRQIGVEYADAFVQHRGHAFPQDDSLKQLF